MQNEVESHVPINILELDSIEHTSNRTTLPKCPICLDPLRSNKHTLDCGHSFHTECIVSWFRTGNSSCPNCRDTSEHKMRFWKRRSRFEINKRLSARKNAPRLLKSLVKSWRKRERKRRSDIRAHKTWLKTDEGRLFKKQKKRNDRFLRLQYRAYRVSNLEHLIAEFPVIPAAI
jgi:hypothetical protein